MSSKFPHQGSYKADALSAELQGHIPGLGDGSMLLTTRVKAQNKRSPVSDLLSETEWLLGCLRLFCSFSEYTTSIQRVINYFPYSRRVWIYIHAITRPKMTDDTLSGNLQSYAGQF